MTSPVAFVEQFEAAGFVHTKCPIPQQVLERRSSHDLPDRLEFETWIDRATSQIYARVIAMETKELQWYAMTPTRETLAKIVVTGSGAEAAKL